MFYKSSEFFKYLSMYYSKLCLKLDNVELYNLVYYILFRYFFTHIMFINIFQLSFINNINSLMIYSYKLPLFIIYSNLIVETYTVRAL